MDTTEKNVMLGDTTVPFIISHSFVMKARSLRCAHVLQSSG